LLVYRCRYFPEIEICLSSAGPRTILEELENLPADPILSTPTVKAKSYSDLLLVPDQPVLRSRSEENLDHVVQLSDLVCSERLAQVLKDLDEYREEQNRLEQQQKELTEKIRQRKAEFKELWGLSPMSISRAKTRLPLAVLGDITNTEVIKNNNSALGDGVHHAPDAGDADGDDSDQENLCPDDARRVRFNSGENAEKFLTPNSSFQNTPSSLSKSDNTSFSNRSFASLKSSFAFLQTPVVRVARKRFTDRLEEEDEESALNNSDGMIGVPTPVALRSLSNRVKEEFARLYADSSDETEQWKN